MKGCRPVAARMRPGLSWAVLVTVGWLSGCTLAQPEYAPFESGPWEVRHNDSILITDTTDNREIKVQVAWPAGAAESAGPFPVVVFSHGAFCFPQQYRNVADHWVSRGYVVIFPNHNDSPNLGKLAPADVQTLLQTRVADMSAVIDSLPAIQIELPDLDGQVDAGRVAVAGHSFGGMIAMIKFGLRMVDAQGVPQPGYADPRFKAAVIMSGVGEMGAADSLPGQPYMAANAFDGLRAPLLASGGTLDEGNVGTGKTYPWQWRMGGYTLAPSGEKYSLVLQDADHYLGGLICRENRGGPADPVAVRTVSGVQQAFLDAYLKNDSAALSWLQAADLVGVSEGRGTLEHK